ncbi:MAG: hypothetical protein IID05_06405, partial [Gemmatimonadetes bacterium]|nr:hypothetical protein [Gemmatimonadota bacterium]
MAYTLRDLSSYIMGEIPRMSQPAATDISKQAWEEIVDERRWTFLWKFGQLHMPAQVTAGTANVTKNSTSVTFDATAITAINLTATPLEPVIGRQFQPSQTGDIYTITAYDSGAGVTTLDKPYGQITNASLELVILNKRYYVPPTPLDFKGWESVIDSEQSYQLGVGRNKPYLDGKDPQRQAFGDPYHVVFVDRGDPTDKGAPRYELWPGPVTRRTLEVTYTTRGLTAHNDVSLPSMAFEFPIDVASSLLRIKAQTKARQWAEAHKGMFSELSRTNWRFLWQQSEQEYVRRLVN